MDGKLRMPQTATYIPICRTVEDEKPRRLPGKARRRGGGRVLFICTLIFGCALVLSGQDTLQTLDINVLDVQPMLETLGLRTREAVQAFAGLSERVEAVWNPAEEAPAETETAEETPVHTTQISTQPAITYYGESAAPDLQLLSGTTAAAAAQSSTSAAKRTVSTDPENTEGWPEIVTASVTVPAFDYTLPVAGRITSDFGFRDHPVDGENKFHYGVDIAANEGTPIGAFADGTVIYAGVGEINGNYIKIRHDDGYVSLYAHMSEIGVEWGQTVKTGDTVGLVGQTGTATGPHLHLQLYHEGLLFDPVLLLGDALGV